MKRIKVSIIVPVYNAEKFLNRCVDSILAQSYRNFELLLIDDGSEDNSGVICDEYATIDNRIRVMHKDNTGVSSTRNMGLREAKGEYIVFVDSDDYIKSQMLEKMIQCAEKNNSDIVMCGYYLDKSGDISEAQMNYNEVYGNAESVKYGLLYLYYTDYHNGLFCLWNKMIKRTLCSVNNILFDISLKRGEDAWFIFQCLKHCKRVDYIPEACYYYCQNENSIMHSLYEDQYEQWVKMRKRLLSENKILKFEIDYSLFYKEFYYKVVVYCRDLAKCRNKKKIKEILSDSFYINATQYAKGLPKHVMFLTKCVKSQMINIATLIYMVWARL